MREAYLIVRSSRGRRNVPLGQGPVTIGRHRGNVLRLGDDSVSRYHCVIERSGEVVTLRDLGSSNGTRVNGERVETAELRVGDVVRVGGASIELAMPGEAPRRSPTGHEERGPDGRPAL